MYSYFIWKGINSLDKNIIVNKCPDFQIPDSNITKTPPIPGRDGFLTLNDGTYQGTIKTCECSLDNGDLSDICTWLTGSGEVIFSNEHDKKYLATIINKVPFVKIIPIFHTFIIQFECQPHKYSLNNDVITLDAPGTIFNIGSVNSKPIIKIYGSGTITLTINDTIISLTNIADYVVIDSDLIDCYKDTELKNNDMTGEFPELEPGINNISWVGTVSKIEITLNSRFL